MVSLANILHRSKYSLDAAILMHAALETTTDYDIVYFTLGNIYGVKRFIILLSWESVIIHFTSTLQLIDYKITKVSKVPRDKGLHVSCCRCDSHNSNFKKKYYVYYYLRKNITELGKGLGSFLQFIMMLKRCREMFL